MSTHNIGFYEDLTKIIFELSSNTHLISNTDVCSKSLRTSLPMVLDKHISLKAYVFQKVLHQLN